MGAKTASVDVQKERDATVVTVTPGSARRVAWLFWIGLACMISGWLSRDLAGSFAWLLIALGAASFLLGFGDVRPKAHRETSVIRVSDAGFDVNGVRFSRDSVKRLIARDRLHAKEPPRSVAFTGPSAAEAFADLAEGAYEIVLDADHKDMVIAGGLSAQSVDRLLRGLCDASGRASRRV